MSELPAGWAEASIGDLADLNPKQAFDDETIAGFVPMSHAPTNFLDKLRFEERPWGEIKKAYTNFKDGDVIFAKVTPCFENGKAAYVEGLPNGIGAGSSEFFVLRPSCDDVSARYLLALVKSHSFLSEGAENMTGAVGLRRVPKQFVESYPVKVPPAAEQIRIAAKLDELLAQVDTLKARIDGIPALLKRFRQSVLAAAVSGRLTEEWRSENPTSASQAPLSIPQDDASGTSLPTGWSSKNAGDICGFITKGTTPSKEKMTAGQGEIPYIKVYNLTFSGTLDFSIDPTFVDSNTHTTELKRSIVKPGDVLMNIVGPPLGKVSVVPDTYPEWNINQAIARFRADDEISSEYLALCLRTEEVLNHAVSRAKATAGQFNLTLEICRELPLPVPPKEEQTEIVRRVEHLFAFADQLEARIKAAQTRIDRLTQSILAKAFRGELVPQDPNDEPASVLLERIKAQRAAAPKAKRGRRTATLS